MFGSLFGPRLGLAPWQQRLANQAISLGMNYGNPGRAAFGVLVQQPEFKELLPEEVRKYAELNPLQFRQGKLPPGLLAQINSKENGIVQNQNNKPTSKGR